MPRAINGSARIAPPKDEVDGLVAAESPLPNE